MVEHLISWTITFLLVNRFMFLLLIKTLFLSVFSLRLFLASTLIHAIQTPMHACCMNDHYVSGDEAAADAAARAYWAMEAAAPASSSPSSSGGKAKTATPSAAQAPAVLPFGVKARRRHYTHFSLFVVLDKSRCFLFYFVENTPSKYAVFLFS